MLRYLFFQRRSGFFQLMIILKSKVELQLVKKKKQSFNDSLLEQAIPENILKLDWYKTEENVNLFD